MKTTTKIIPAARPKPFVDVLDNADLRRENTNNNVEERRSESLTG